MGHKTQYERTDLRYSVKKTRGNRTQNTGPNNTRNIQRGKKSKRQNTASSRFTHREKKLLLYKWGWGGTRGKVNFAVWNCRFNIVYCKQSVLFFFFLLEGQGQCGRGE